MSEICFPLRHLSRYLQTGVPINNFNYLLKIQQTKDKLSLGSFALDSTFVYWQRETDFPPHDLRFFQHFRESWVCINRLLENRICRRLDSLLTKLN